MSSPNKRKYDWKQHLPDGHSKKTKTAHKPQKNRDHVVHAQSGPSHEVSKPKPNPEQFRIPRPITRQSPSASAAPVSSSTTGSLPELPPIPSDIAKVVFTHPEALHGPNLGKIDASYDRLEFLGDAYIELMASRLVLKRFPQMPAGRLSQQREMLVKNDTLAEYANKYGMFAPFHPALPSISVLESDHSTETWSCPIPGFPTRIIIPPETLSLIQTKSKPPHHHSSGPTPYTKLIADVFEAYIAAIVLSSPSPSPSPLPQDKGFHTAESFLHALWSHTLSARPATESRMMDPDAKATLATRLLSRGIRLDYRETRPRQEIRKEGKTWFSVGVYLTGWGYKDELLGEGKGLNKQEAGQKAAEDALGKKNLVGELEGVKRVCDERNRREKEEREAKRGELERAEEAVRVAGKEVEAAREKMGKAEERVRVLKVREGEVEVVE